MRGFVSKQYRFFMAPSGLACIFSILTLLLEQCCILRSKYLFISYRLRTFDSLTIKRVDAHPKLLNKHESSDIDNKFVEVISELDSVGPFRCQRQISCQLTERLGQAFLVLRVILSRDQVFH